MNVQGFGSPIGSGHCQVCKEEIERRVCNAEKSKASVLPKALAESPADRLTGNQITLTNKKQMYTLEPEKGKGNISRVITTPATLTGNSSKAVSDVFNGMELNKRWS